MAPCRGYSLAYVQMIIEKQMKERRKIPQLEVAIMEGIIQFAAEMVKYSRNELPGKTIAYVAVILPHSFKNLNYKILLGNHMEVMLRFGRCVFQGRCFFFGLPICRWCEKDAAWYPPGYYVPYDVLADGWDDNAAETEE